MYASAIALTAGLRGHRRVDSEACGARPSGL